MLCLGKNSNGLFILTSIRPVTHRVGPLHFLDWVSYPPLQLSLHFIKRCIGTQNKKKKLSGNENLNKYWSFWSCTFHNVNHLLWQPQVSFPIHRKSIYKKKNLTRREYFGNVFGQISMVCFVWYGHRPNSVWNADTSNISYWVTFCQFRKFIYFVLPQAILPKNSGERILRVYYDKHLSHLEILMENMILLFAMKVFFCVVFIKDRYIKLENSEQASYLSFHCILLDSPWETHRSKKSRRQDATQYCTPTWAKKNPRASDGP